MAAFSDSLFELASKLRRFLVARSHLHLGQSLRRQIECILTGVDRNGRAPDGKRTALPRDAEQIIAVRFDTAELGLAIAIGRAGIFDVVLDRTQSVAIELAEALGIED